MQPPDFKSHVPGNPSNDNPSNGKIPDIANTPDPEKNQNYAGKNRTKEYKRNGENKGKRVVQ